MTEPTTPKVVAADAPIDEIIDALCDLDRLREVAVIAGISEDVHDRLNAIAERSQHRLHSQISLVTLVLDSAQMALAVSGLGGWIVASGGTPIEWSFCARSVASREAYVVPDTHVDPVQKNNPLVTIDGIGAYAGVPLVTSNGQVLGAHCVIDTEAHTYTEADLDELRRAADEIVELFDGIIAQYSERAA